MSDTKERVMRQLGRKDEQGGRDPGDSKQGFAAFFFHPIIQLFLFLDSGQL
jgi:hypothetical protein